MCDRFETKMETTKRRVDPEFSTLHCKFNHELICHVSTKKPRPSNDDRGVASSVSRRETTIPNNCRAGRERGREPF